MISLQPEIFKFLNILTKNGNAMTGRYASTKNN